MTDRIQRLETLWERLSQAIDRAGRDHETLFLSKLTLLLAQELPDATVDESIETALRDLT